MSGQTLLPRMMRSCPESHCRKDDAIRDSRMASSPESEFQLCEACVLLRPRVRDPQQHVGVTRLVERAPAGEIFAVQTVTNIALAEIISEVLLV